MVTVVIMIMGMRMIIGVGMPVVMAFGMIMGMGMNMDMARCRGVCQAMFATSIFFWYLSWLEKCFILLTILARSYAVDTPISQVFPGRYDRFCHFLSKFTFWNSNWFLGPKGPHICLWVIKTVSFNIPNLCFCFGFRKVFFFQRYALRTWVFIKIYCVCRFLRNLTIPAPNALAELKWREVNFRTRRIKIEHFSDLYFLMDGLSSISL